MSITVPGAAKPGSLMPGKAWKCVVCGYTFWGEDPPAECPQCAGTVREFIGLSEKKAFRYNGEQFDVLLINGSSHRANNTSYLSDLAEDVLREKGVSYRRIIFPSLPSTTAGAVTACGTMPAATHAGTSSMICPHSMRW